MFDDSIGKLIIDTVLDDTGFKKGSKDLENACKSLVNTTHKVADKQKEQFNNLFEQANKSAEKYGKTIETLEAKLESLNNEESKLNQQLDSLSNRETATKEYAEIQKQIEKTESKLNSLNDKKERFLENGGKEKSSSFKNMQYDIDELEKSLPYLKGELTDLENKGINVITGGSEAEYEKIEEKLKKVISQKDLLNLKLNETKEKVSAAGAESDRLLEIGRNAETSDEYIIGLNRELTELKSRQMDLSKAGIGIGYEEYDRNAAKISAINKELIEYTKGLQSVDYESKNVQKNGFSSHLENIKNKLNNIIKNIKKSTGHLLSFNKEAKRTNGNAVPLAKSIFKLGNMFKLLVLRMAMRGVIKAVQDGFKNLVQYSDEANGSVSLLMNALTQLKNSFATAFAPLLSVVSPIISNFINQISKALSYVSQFISALTGSATFIKATTVQDDYAASLDNTASAAKKAANSLASFDHMEVLNKKDKSSGSGTSPSDMFTTETVTPEVKNLADKVKKILDDFFRPLKASWNKYGKYVTDAWKYALNEIKLLLADIGRDFLKVWNEEETIAILDNILLIIADIGLTIGNIAHQFREAWNTNDLGLRILENIRDIIGIIISNIKYAADATVDWSSKLNFEPLLSAIERFTRALIPLFNALSGIMADFYVEVLLPLSKWALEKGLPMLLDVMTEFVDSVDWAAIRQGFSDFWKALEPFAETVGEGLILFFQDILQLASEIINSDLFKSVFEKLESWMKKVSAEDVENALWVMAGTIIAFKVAMLGLNAITAINGALTTITTFLGWFSASGEGATVAAGMGETSVAAGTLATALGYLVTAIAGLAVVDKVKDPLLDFMDKITGETDNLADTMKEKYNGIAGVVEYTGDTVSAITQKISEQFTGVPIYIDGVTESSEYLAQALKNVENGSTFTNEQLEKMASQAGLTNDDIDTLIQAMIDYNDKLDLGKLGMENYNGSFTEMRGEHEQTIQSLQNVKTQTENTTSIISNSSKTIENANANSSRTFKDMESSATSSVDNVKNSMQGLESQSGTSLSNVSNKVGETNTSFSTLEENTSQNLSNMSLKMEEWFNTTVATYFSEDTWNAFGETINTCMASAIDTFIENWNTRFAEWDASNTEQFLGYDKWYETFNNMNLAYIDVWNVFIETWKVNIGNWWKNMVEPYFTVEKWKLFGTNMKTGILSGFNVIISEIGGSMNKIIDIFNQGVKNIADSINDLIDQYNSIAHPLGVSSMSHVSPGSIKGVSIPKLATGAVIPPNSEFLAMLGDQKHGTNIEAPADLIKQMVKQGLAEMGYTSQGSSSSQPVIFNLNGEEFARIVLPLLQSENNRIGTDLTIQPT